MVIIVAKSAVELLSVVAVRIVVGIHLEEAALQKETMWGLLKQGDDG